MNWNKGKIRLIRAYRGIQQTKTLGEPQTPPSQKGKLKLSPKEKTKENELTIR